MNQMASVQVWFDRCPDCGIKITLQGELPVGRLLICPSCGTALGFVETTRDEPDWAFDAKDFGELEIEDLEDWSLYPLPMPA